MFDVACIGILVADVITRTVDEFPARGKLTAIDSLQLYSGGCAMSASVDLKKLGCSVAVLGMAGNDGFGAFLKKELELQGVNVDGLCMTEQAGTSASVVLVDSSGERSFLHAVGANGLYRESDVNYAVIAESNIVFVGGSLLLPGFDGEGCAKCLKRVKKMGKTTVLDTAWDDHGRWMSAIAPSLPYVDYFIPSIDEAQMLSGETEPERIAEVFFAHGVGCVVIKLGKDGCYLQEAAGLAGHYIPACTGVTAIDTTGAGDSFCAGFLYGISHGFSPLEACRLANAVGAHCVMAVGATTGIKPYAQIKAFLDAQLKKEA